MEIVILRQPSITTGPARETSHPGDMPDAPSPAAIVPGQAATIATNNLPVTFIEPPTNWPRLNLGELWRYRDLLILLIWRDVSARYRQSIVGYGWAIIKPVLSMLIFTVIFGWVAKLPSEGAP